MRQHTSSLTSPSMLFYPTSSYPSADAQVSNKEIYNPRNILNPNLGHNDGVHNNTASATSLIIIRRHEIGRRAGVEGGEEDEEENNNSNEWAPVNYRRIRANSADALQGEEEDVGADAYIKVDDSQVITSFNGAGRLDSNYNEHTLAEDEETDSEVMNDGFHLESTTTPTPDTPHFLEASQRSQEPIFDPSTPRNVTALVGKSAYLNCRVRNLANKTVCTTWCVPVDS